MAMTCTTIASGNCAPRASNYSGKSAETALGDFKEVGDSGDVGKILPQRTAWRRYFLEFFRDTSLHGLKYVADEKSHFVERIFWLAAFALGVSCSGYLIQDVFRKWQESPIFVSFHTSTTPIWNITFPAITICNINQARKSEAKKILSQKKSGEEAARDRFLLRHVCSSGGFTFIPFKQNPNETDDIPPVGNDWWKEDEEESQNVTGRDIQDFLHDVAQPCDSLLLQCSFKGDISDCNKLFHPVVTDHGQCCSFNILPVSLMFKNRTRRSRQKKKMFSDLNAKPESVRKNSNDSESLRQIYPGKRLGLTVTLHEELEDYFCISGNSTGFLAVIHNSEQYPAVNDYSLALSSGKETFVELTPHVTTANKRIQTYPAHQRGCYFQDEKPLLFYNHYSRHNCVTECDANYFLKLCNCVLYYMPRDDETPLCGSDEMSCVQKAIDDLEGLHGPRWDCNCLPSCTDLDFTAEMSATPLANLHSTDPIFSKKKNIAMVHFFLGQSHFVAKHRNVLYGTSDLLANTGGLLGLCLGFSGLSAIEVIYFLTLRPWCRSRNRMRGEDNGSIHGTNMA